MHSTLLELLVDPVSKTPLRVEARHCHADGQILEGTLCASETRRYPITNGIPRFVLTTDADQLQTSASFGFKWAQRQTYDSPQRRAIAQEWLVQRYSFRGVEPMRRWFSTRRRILDAGCGSGFSTSLWMDESWHAETEWVGVDISGAIDVAQERLAALPGTHFVQADLLQLPFRDQAFDAIFSEGVLHHTPSLNRALQALVAVLEPGGELWFYVYRKKGAIREFTDDHIRHVVSSLEPHEAWEALRPLTKLGQALALLQTEVEVPEDIPYLGIKAGRYDVQRFLYWHVAKAFWNDALSFDENHHVNFDWYHPRYAHRYTEDDVRRACEGAGVAITYCHEEESGWTVRAVKRAGASACAAS